MLGTDSLGGLPPAMPAVIATCLRCIMNLIDPLRHRAFGCTASFILHDFIWSWHSSADHKTSTSPSEVILLLYVLTFGERA